MSKKKRMKKYGFEEISKKSIHSKDLVKPTMELLIVGSNGSKVCDDVENEINNNKLVKYQKNIFKIMIEKIRNFLKWEK